jgi:class 3 adenylate cyclase
VVDLPQTRYAKTDEGAHIAYQTLGDGPPDLVFLEAWGSHVDMGWELPMCRKVYERLARFSRLIRFDMRGSGLSDPLGISERPTFEDRAKEMLAVLDAARSERAAIVANNSGGLLAVFFAATYPNRVESLSLDGCYATLIRSPDYPSGIPAELLEQALRQVEESESPPGETALGFLAPNALKDEEFVSQWSRYARSRHSPTTGRVQAKVVISADVRPLLPTVQTPTLVIHRMGDQWIRKPHATYLAEHIPNAEMVTIPGDDNLIFVGDSDADMDEIEEFLTGVRHAPETDRVLATVLFTDIVASTERAAELGDRKWHELLDAHDRTVRRQLDRFRGREVNTAGDGFLATFDGPGRAIQCACAIRDAVGALGMDVRAGLHTGEVEVREDDVAGMAVHIGARVSALAQPGEVLVSGAVPPLVAGSNLEFEYRGEHQLKGVPGFWKVFAVGGEAAR